MGRWDLVAILGIPVDLQSDSLGLWDPAADDGDCSCSVNRIVTYDEIYVDVGSTHWDGCGLGSLRGVGGGTVRASNRSSAPSRSS